MKRSLTILLITLLTGISTNSCKKQEIGYVNTWLTASPWQLASIYVYRYQGSLLLETDTLNTTCLLKQTFKFSTDQSCSYQNYICRQGTSTGKWKFSDDKLTLISDMICKDTIGGRDTTLAPFKNAQIMNLGSYSLVLQTGDVNQFYTANTKRVIKRYSFIHQ